MLTAAGWSVVVLEKGRNHLLDLEPPFGPLGEVSNDEIKFTRRHFLGPDPLLEPRVFRTGEDESGDVGEVNNLPSTVGGGGFHADGKLPRFREDDFQPAQRAGPVDGADLVDWPVDYDEMEPYYAAAERVVGVAGEAGANPFASWRADPYPMPPGPDMYCAVRHQRGRRPGSATTRTGRRPASTASSTTAGPPATTAASAATTAARSTPRATPSRRCGTRCGPAAARSGPRRTSPTCCATRPGRRAPRRPVPRPRPRRARGVGRATWSSPAGAFETPRLLLRTGLGNPDVVGRHLMYHFQTFVLGIFPYRLHGHRGRSVTHLMDDPIVPDAAALAAAARRRAAVHPGRHRRARRRRASDPWRRPTTPPGERHARRDARLADARPHGGVHHAGRGPPRRPTNRIDLDPAVNDVFGYPAGRVTYLPHRHEVVCAEHWAPGSRR